VPKETSPAELAGSLRAGRPLLLIDVREPWEREVGAIAGDLHVPLGDLPRRAKELAPPDGAEIVVYCHLGVRSWMAAEYLEQARGWRDVGSLAGGIDAWSILVDPAVPRY
jgi:adenylyltransferase/sulfurtransferase